MQKISGRACPEIAFVSVPTHHPPPPPQTKNPIIISKSLHYGYLSNSGSDYTVAEQTFICKHSEITE